MAPSIPRSEVEPGRWLDARRVLWLEPERVLVVADLHWGYAASHRAAGNLLPGWGDNHLAATLDQVVATYQPAEMIWLGDVVHAAAGRPAAERYLARAAVPIVVLRGNHDRSWRQEPLAADCTRGGFWLHHGDQTLPAPPGCRELVGHHHPAAVLRDGAGTRLKLPALVTGPRRWIMPAFSPWAAGTPWNRELQPDETLWALTARRILRLPPRAPASPPGSGPTADGLPPA